MEEGVKKKGYSIWSLLVIMTLLAVWIVIPRSTSGMPTYRTWIFFAAHQIAIWSLAVALIWQLSGKRRLVLYLLVGGLVGFWWPAVARIAEHEIAGTSNTIRWLNAMGLKEVYQDAYHWMYLNLGYAKDD